jgi:hypothetical protein
MPQATHACSTHIDALLLASASACVPAGLLGCWHRGTDFEDKGDILVDGDCQYTDNKGEYFGSKRDIRLHTGFFRAWESVAPQVTAHMLRQLQQVGKTGL